MTEAAMWARAMRSLALRSGGAVPERLGDEEEDQEETEAYDDGQYTVCC